jgi:hypothetical protein
VSLIELQRELLQLCCGPAPTEAQLARVGDPRVFGLYRELIRNRLRGELKHALKRTHAAVGAAAFERAFERHMLLDPPRTRFFHALVSAFEKSAVPVFESDPSVPAYVGDLCRYESALWTVGDLPDVAPEVAGEFAFDKVPVLSPALRLLALRHAVHQKPADDGGYAAGEFYVCIHRRPEESKPKIWALNALAFELLRQLATASQPAASAIQQVAAARGIAMDEKFVDGLCTVLADAIERGIVLGAR